MNHAPNPANSASGTLVIGVDGGGTKTEAVLYRVKADRSLHRVAQCITGPSNLQLACFAGLTGQVRAAIDGLLDRLPAAGDGAEGDGADGSGDPPFPVSAICLCMAGAGNEPLRQRFEAWVGSQRWAPRIMVTHDARCLVAAGTRRDVGLALIAGTGSLAYGRRADGAEDRCGGWGSLFGDEGSGYWLALQALRAASWAVDGRGPSTRLVDALSQWLECERPEQWLVQLRTFGSDRIASASKLVTQLAEEDDAVAGRLVDRCAEELARMITTLAGRSFADQPIDLALAGGLIVHNEPLREAVISRARQAGVCIDHWQTVSHPVDGAVRLAAQMA